MQSARQSVTVFEIVKVFAKEVAKMNYDIRQLCVYFNDIHSRYYIDTNGSVYTSLSPRVKKVMIDGKRTTVTSFVNNVLPFLNRTDKQIERMPFKVF